MDNEVGKSVSRHKEDFKPNPKTGRFTVYTSLTDAQIAFVLAFGQKRGCVTFTESIRAMIAHVEDLGKR